MLMAFEGFAAISSRSRKGGETAAATQLRRRRARGLNTCSNPRQVSAAQRDHGRLPSILPVSFITMTASLEAIFLTHFAPAHPEPVDGIRQGPPRPWCYGKDGWPTARRRRRGVDVAARLSICIYRCVLETISWTELSRRTWREVVDDDVLGLSAQLSYISFSRSFQPSCSCSHSQAFFRSRTSPTTWVAPSARSCRRRSSN